MKFNLLSKGTPKRFSHSLSLTVDLTMAVNKSLLLLPNIIKYHFASLNLK